MVGGLVGGICDGGVVVVGAAAPWEGILENFLVRREKDEQGWRALANAAPDARSRTLFRTRRERSGPANRTARDASDVKAPTVRKPRSLESSLDERN